MTDDALNNKPSDQPEADVTLLSYNENKEGNQVEILLSSLEREKDNRKEERFLWILISVILLNITFFTAMESIVGPIVISLFQLIAFVILARKMGQDEIVQIIDRLVSSVAIAAKRAD